MNRLIAATLIYGLILTGCAVPVQTAPLATLTPVPAAQTPPGSTATATATNSPTPLPAFTPTPEPVVTPNCFTIQPYLPDHATRAGTLILSNPIAGTEDYLALYNLQSGEEAVFTQPGFQYPLVSPDHSMFAIENHVAKTLEIFSASGDRIKVLGWRDDWGRLAGWLDDQRMAITMYKPPVEGERNEKYPPDTTILNLSTGQTQVLLADYPDIDRTNQTYLGNWGATVYDPSLTRVVYSGSLTGSSPTNPRTGVILYDIPGQKKLAEILNPYTKHLPIWYASVSRFVVWAGSEFFQVNADGEVTQLTAINPGFIPLQETPLDYLIDRGYSLSPDEEHLAFWLVVYDQNLQYNQFKVTLAILDMQTGRVIDTCVPAGHAYGSGNLFYPYPVWSPDGSSLVIAANYRPEQEDRDLMVVDLDQQEAYQLPGNWLPAGWLAPKP